MSNRLTSHSIPHAACVEASLQAVLCQHYTGFDNHLTYTIIGCLQCSIQNVNPFHGTQPFFYNTSFAIVETTHCIPFLLRIVIPARLLKLRKISYHVDHPSFCTSYHHLALDGHLPRSTLFLHEDILARTLSYERQFQTWRINELESG